MSRFRIRIVVGVLIGVVCCTAFLEIASACFLRRRQCCWPRLRGRAVCCQTCSGSEKLVPKDATPADEEATNSARYLPQLSDVPEEVPDLIVPAQVAELEQQVVAPGDAQTSAAGAPSRLLGVRTWTHRDGRATDAQFVSFSDNIVRLSKAGRIYELPLDQLSSDDKALIAAETLLVGVDGR